MLLRNVKYVLTNLGLGLGLGQIFGLMLVFAAFADAPKIVVLGDSLAAGYQLPPGEGFPEQLQKTLSAREIKVVITSAGVSGDTTSGGLSRLDWSVPEGTNGVVLELGANDAMRGLPFELAQKNLDTMIARLTERGIAVLLVGMRAPPNMGEDYQQGFDAIYPTLAAKYDVPLYPFFLDGVAANPMLNLADGIHPNQAGIAVMIERILPYVERFVEQMNGAN